MGYEEKISFMTGLYLQSVKDILIDKHPQLPARRSMALPESLGHLINYLLKILLQLYSMYMHIIQFQKV